MFDNYVIGDGKLHSCIELIQEHSTTNVIRLKDEMLLLT